MTKEYTYFLTLVRANGTVLDTYFIGGSEGWNLDKSLGRSVLMDEIRTEIDLDKGDEEEESE